MAECAKFNPQPSLNNAWIALVRLVLSNAFAAAAVYLRLNDRNKSSKVILSLILDVSFIHLMYIHLENCNMEKVSQNRIGPRTLNKYTKAYER